MHARNAKRSEKNQGVRCQDSGMKLKMRTNQKSIYMGVCAFVCLLVYVAEHILMYSVCVCFVYS